MTHLHLRKTHSAKLMNSKILLTALAIPLLLFTSCDPQPAEDAEAPTLNLATELTADYVKGTLTLKGGALDNGGVKKIQLLVDGVVVKETTEDTFVLTWNTESVADGKHALEILAFDKADNKTSLSYEVQVWNYFLNLNVPVGFIPPFTEGWFFVSLTNGNVVGVHKIENGTAMRFNTPDGFKTGDTFMLNFFFSRKIGQFPYRFVESYSEFKAGAYNLKPGHWLDGKALSGTHQINVDNTGMEEDFGRYAASGPEVIGAIANLVDGSYQLTTQFTAKKNLRALVAVAPGLSIGPRYKQVSGLNTDGVSSIDFSTMQKMDSATCNISVNNRGWYYATLAIPSASNTNVSLFQEVWHDYYDATEESKPLKIFYPGNLSEKYSFQTTVLTPNCDYSNVNIETLPASFEGLNAQVQQYTRQDSLFKLTSTGDCDYASVSAWKPRIVNGMLESHNAWDILVPNHANGSSFILPHVPQEILSEVENFPSAESFNFKYLSFTDFHDFHGYGDYLQYLFNTPEVTFYMGEYKSVAWTSNAGAGRIDYKEDANFRKERTRLKNQQWK
jgi:hypothetical protein